MGRRHTAGSVGNQGVGGVQVDNTTLSAADNLDITIDPSGTGIFKIAGDAQLQAQGDLRFADADSSNYVAFQAPATVASNVTWTLPSSDGSDGQALVTNGSGTLTFSAAGASVTDNISDSGTNYLTFTTQSSGFLTAARVATTTRALTYQPSTGLLSVEGTVRSLLTENIQTNSYTLALTDRSRVVLMNNTAPATVTVPTNAAVAFPTGSVIYIGRYNTGTVTLAASVGVTISKSGLLGAKEELFIRKRGTDDWVVFDSPTAGTATASGGTGSVSAPYTISTFTTTGAATYTVA